MTRNRRLYFILPLTAIALAIATVAMASAGGNSGTSALAINPSDFSANITNPFFPLSTLGPKVLEGEEVDPDTAEVITTRLESRVLPDTSSVAGVEVLVLEEKDYANGELIEVALDFFAQHSDGTVYYFGEDVDNYINGVIDNHDGSWLAGDGANEPGIVMPASPVVGQMFNQENAPGIAEDQGEILALNETVGTTAGEFTGCVKIEDTNPLEPPIVPEFKFYCPNVGLVRVDGPDSFLELTSFSIVQNGSPTPTASPTPSPDGSPTPTDSPTPSPDGSPTPTASPTPTPSAGAATATPCANDDDDDEGGDEGDDADEDEGDDQDDVDCDDDEDADRGGDDDDEGRGGDDDDDGRGGDEREDEEEDDD